MPFQRLRRDPVCRLNREIAPSHEEMIFLLMALGLGRQDTDLDRLIDQLGDPSPAVRHQASEAIEDRGPTIIPQLLPAARHDDAEIRCRAKTILSHLDPSIFLDERKTARRAVVLQPPGDPDPYWPSPAAIEGGWFTFSRMHWKEGREITGSVLYTSCVFDGGWLRWEIASVAAGSPVSVEFCQLHSPGKIFVRGDPAGPCTVRIKGVRRWTCPVPVVFRKPEDGDRRRVGPFTLTLRWPELEISDADPPLWPEDLPILVSCAAKPGRKAPTQLAIRGTPDDEPAIFFPEAVEKEGGTADRGNWCDCPASRRKRPDPPSDRGLRKVRVKIESNESLFLSDLSSITLTFPLPVEEPFEVTSPPIH